MNYTEAIRLALAGEQRGFSFLYETTYQKKYFLALQYMKNEAAAEDVMQEAYIRAFSKLSTLEDPEKFPSWLGTIVANMAKNALKKKNPMVFSDIAADDEREVFEYQIEDDNIEHMPETAYTREETRQLAHQLLDSLSEEQRMCILMFHIEGLSIREIASELECSENTVKSRLKYGRDNIKKKGEELQKKGYQLYSVAPLPLLLYLLQKEAAYMEADGSLKAAGARIAERVMTGSGMKMVKSGFLHTVAGKVTVAAVGLCLAGGAVAYGVSQRNANEEVVEPKTVIEEQEVKEEEAPVLTVKEVQDTEYETLIAGNLTKEELEYVLAYGPLEIPKQGFQRQDYWNILNSLCEAQSQEGMPMIEDYGADENWRQRYSVSDVNRIFQSFTDYQFTEEDNILSENDVIVQGDVIGFYGSSLSRSSDAVITSASYTEEEMEIYYTYDYGTLDMAMEGIPNKIEHKKALLKPNAEGLYQIVAIEALKEDSAENGEAGAEETPEFPVGSYSFAIMGGGGRGNITIDAAGVLTYTEWSGGTGLGSEIKYQMVADNTAAVSDGVTAYILQFIEGHEMKWTDDGFEATGDLKSRDNWSLYYDANQKILQDPDSNGTWEFVE